MDIIKFYESYNVLHATEGTKHTRKGWVNAVCPFCSGYSSSYHLGVHLSSGAVKCWKCGTHSQMDIVKKVLNCDWIRALEVFKEFGGESKTKQKKKHRRERARMAPQCKLPPEAMPMTERHLKYLQNRRFDAEKITELWGLMATEAIGEYKWRIIAPIYLEGRIVSYQGRDITNKSKLKYKACPQNKEVIKHQSIVYGLDNVTDDSCVVVEGITDVWRLGYGAVCCFGTAFTLAQVNLISEKVKVVYVLFDGGEEQSQIMANELAFLLSAKGNDVELVLLDEGDPADLSQEKADHLMKDLGFTNN